MPPSIAVALNNNLQKISNLNVLKVANKNIGIEGAIDIAAVLSHNTNLQKLYLGENNLKSAGAIKITKGLQNTVKLI